MRGLSGRLAQLLDGDRRAKGCPGCRSRGRSRPALRAAAPASAGRRSRRRRAAGRRCGKTSFRKSIVGAAMSVDTLRCRVCEAEYPAVASGSCVRCFGPLEPVYDWDAIARTVSRERIEAGPRSLWRYERCCPPSAPADAAGGPGWTPLVRAPRLASARRRRRGLPEARPHEPDALLQGPRRRRRRGEGGRARHRHARLRLDRQPRQRRRRARRGGRHALGRPLPGRPSSRRSCSRPRSTAARCTPCAAPTTTARA